MRLSSAAEVLDPGNSEVELAPLGQQSKDVAGHGQTPKNRLESFLACFALAVPVFRDASVRLRAWTAFAVLCLLKVVHPVVAVSFSNIAKGYNNALHDRDEDAFWRCIYTFLLLILVLLGIHTVETALIGSMQVEWRRFISHGLLRDYIGNQAFYRLKLSDMGLDNPDQRIGQDVAGFTKLAIVVVSRLVGSAVMTLGMSVALWNVSPLLCSVLMLGSLSVTLLMFLGFGLPLMRIERVLLSCEASLRFALVRVRENAEQVVFFQGAAFELARCLELLSSVLSKSYSKLFTVVGFEAAKNSLMMLSHGLPALILAPAYFRNEVTFGDITKGSMLFNVLLMSVMSIVLQLEEISGVGAQATRIRQLQQGLEQFVPSYASDTSQRPLHKQGLVVQELDDSAVCLGLEEVALRPPGSSMSLIQSLSLSLSDGESLLVCGPSGIGKTSLMRAIGGLWSNGEGVMKRCRADQCFFLPQSPYMCVGSLRDNVVYPQKCEGKAGNILQALEEANLGHVQERFGLDEHVDWDDVLSGGEKQRLGFARLFFRSKETVIRFAVLDEATSAADTQNEDLVYGALRKHVRCFLSVGHRTNLEKFHSHRLTLGTTQGGGCTGVMSPIGGA